MIQGNKMRGIGASKNIAILSPFVLCRMISNEINWNKLESKNFGTISKCRSIYLFLVLCYNSFNLPQKKRNQNQINMWETRGRLKTRPSKKLNLLLLKSSLVFSGGNSCSLVSWRRPGFSSRVRAGTDLSSVLTVTPARYLNWMMNRFCSVWSYSQNLIL